MTNGENGEPPARPMRRAGLLHLIGRTLRRAWDGGIFSESAEAAFWQTLSLPPLLLGLMGSIGFIGDWLGDTIVSRVYDNIIDFSDTVFSDNVVSQIIEPTVDDVLTTGKGEIVSIGFLISLWAGSSAMASFVDAITVAHNQDGLRHEVWQRLFALLLYLASLILLVIGLPIIAIGPEMLPEFFPAHWQATIASWVGALYYPTLAVLLVLALATLYKVVLPRRLPWYRGLPGAILAMIIFLLSSTGLRWYIGWITTTGYTYGALATPIAFLLFTFFIGLAIVGGAYFNSAIQELWPVRTSRRKRLRKHEGQNPLTDTNVPGEGERRPRRAAIPWRRAHRTRPSEDEPNSVDPPDAPEGPRLHDLGAERRPRDMEAGSEGDEPDHSSPPEGRPS